MGHATAIQFIKSAAKRHICSWCKTPINVGEPYERWRWYEDGRATTVRMHTDCCNVVNNNPDFHDGWIPGDNPRGCDCGYDPNCERCATKAKEVSHGDC